MPGTQASYEVLIQRVATRLEKAIQRLEKGGDVDRFAKEFIDIIDEGHLGAVYEGRVLAGVRGAIGEEDRILARDLADRHADFAESFLDDIDTGRYGEPGSYSGAGIRNRAFMYLDTVRGTANESFVVNSEPDEEWDWVLGTGEHCEDCLFMANNSPLRTDELWTYPGGGETDCRAKCKCKLRRKSDGTTGFTAVRSRYMATPATGKPGSNPGDTGERVAASA
jgi:hypothetical protein